MPASIDSTADRSVLRDAYYQLTETQKSIVQIFALLYEPMSRPQAYACWNQGFEDFPEEAAQQIKALSTNQFSQEVSKLIRQGLLTQLKQQGPRCHPQVMEVAIREAVLADTFEPMAAAIEDKFPGFYYYQGSVRNFRSQDEFLQSLRIAIYREDSAAIDSLFSEISHLYWRDAFDFFDVLRKVLSNPFDSDWMTHLSDGFFEMGLSAIFGHSIEHCQPAPAEAFEVLEIVCTEVGVGAEMTILYAEQLWLRGLLTEADSILGSVTEKDDFEEYAYQYYALKGAIAFLQGENKAAIAHYQKGIQVVGSGQAEQAAWFTLPAAALFFCALLKAKTDAHMDANTGIGSNLDQNIATYALLLQRQSGHWLAQPAFLLLKVLRMQQGQTNEILEALDQLKDYRIESVGLPAVIESYCLYWLGVETLPNWLPHHLMQQCQQALKASYGWLAAANAELLIQYQLPPNAQSTYTEIVATMREQSESLSLVEIVQRKSPWELSLSALARLTETPTTALVEYGSYRLAWRLHYVSSTLWSLTPLEQKIGKRGGWTKGKPIALKRLVDEYEIPDYVTEQDQQICDTIEVEYEQNSYYYRSSAPSYSFSNRTLLALVGHPLIFLEESPTVRVDLVKGEPELIVKRLEEGDRLRLSMVPPIDKSNLLVFKETPTRIKVMEITDSHRQIAALLGKQNQLEVPAGAEEQVLKAISGVAGLVTVQSDIGGGVEAESVPSDATPRMHLLPAGEGLRASLLVHPFPEGGAYYRPGEGGATVIAEVGGQRLQTQRDLSAEKNNMQTVIDACPVLNKVDQVAGEWILEETTDCLDLLLQLQSLNAQSVDIAGDQVTENSESEDPASEASQSKPQVIIEWPEGEKFKVSRQLGLDDFKFDLSQQQDWFAASGEVQVSEDQVIDLKQLMALLDKTPGQFVALADGEFLALTNEFRQRLETLGRLSTPHGKGLRIHGLAAIALDDMLSDVEQLKVDQAWKEHIARIKAACEIEPAVPETLQAKLRDYQLAGYTWLARLANWGVGACLADDMGLGKTLQGLAIILDRCDQGPSLVVAPTSVCMNWASEAERFAPSLRVQDFGAGNRENRQALLDGLGPSDVVVCSYGLVQQEAVAEMLQTVSWQNIVLDEAQAIKNHATKRSQAVMALNGDFKIIMTGTPIENHLGELWNLFRFINPGLLGSLDSFNLRFAYPIERDKNEAAREALRRLIQPFILRRTKDQVLTELPSRTEITLPVELSKQEMAFYEALRREAVENLANSDAQAGARHLQVLAEIMRLRRACCNPSLVRPELSLESTKLEQFSELISELLENGHKALVFSQFVDHLKILRDRLEQQNISYQYLDGSTSRKKRKQAVDSFQAGEGDIFLISLKAGGSGLNLTAADYVLHMDPWWNPAVEDQASDRAHRIGQQRPVTIYRLVAKGTIEEKIVGLHKVKRDLADSLLAGADMSSKVSTDELLALIQQ